MAPQAAEHLRLTADDLLELGIVEQKIAEPADFTDPGQRSEFMRALGKDLYREIKRLRHEDPDRLIAERIEKYRKIGRYDLYATAPRRKTQRWHFRV